MSQMYPDYVYDANAYEFMAEADLAKGNKPAAAAMLTEYEKQGGRDPGRAEELGIAGRRTGRAARQRPPRSTASTTSIRWTKTCIAISAICGSRKITTPARSANTRRVLAMQPLDQASAQFDLAQAYFAAGQKDKAEDNVLQALEAAPDYRPAQKLLLQLQGSRERKIDRWLLPLKSIWIPPN